MESPEAEEENEVDTLYMERLAKGQPGQDGCSGVEILGRHSADKIRRQSGRQLSLFPVGYERKKEKKVCPVACNHKFIYPDFRCCQAFILYIEIMHRIQGLLPMKRCMFLQSKFAKVMGKIDHLVYDVLYDEGINEKDINLF